MGKGICFTSMKTLVQILAQVKMPHSAVHNATLALCGPEARLLGLVGYYLRIHNDISKFPCYVFIVVSLFIFSVFIWLASELEENA